jgi:hypothetical protein
MLGKAAFALCALMLSCVAAAERISQIEASIGTANVRYAETDDRVYLGVVSSDGGREFNLDRKGIDDFERGAYSVLLINSKSRSSQNNSDVYHSIADNALDDFPLNLESVSAVYIRKHIKDSASEDDAWMVASVSVDLRDNAAPGAPCRRFVVPNGATFVLSAARGAVVYLKEAPDCLNPTQREATPSTRAR